ncbi:Com family DNA-binding transcriptional regulator [Psychrobacter lutiphocae]|uniref:Com family DNA-binding transcriptional regulator n=1 Tax=Psychrobacter lutiphocae TaxID=540500 RepID=UPI000A06B69D
MNFLNCNSCGKKLLKIRTFDELSIKCPRCKTLNYLSVKNAKPEDHESHNLEDKTRGQSKTKAIQQSTATIRRSKA